MAARAMTAWEVGQARRIAAWEATPAGKATKALYAAAAKVAGMAEALRYCECEVHYYEFQGKHVAYLGWEQELREREEFVFPAAAMARAEVWLTRYAVRMGWTTVA